MVTTGVSASRRLLMAVSLPGLDRALWVLPKATIFALARWSFLAFLKYSLSLGFAPGQPPSM